jgi:hypothetical protein
MSRKSSGDQMMEDLAGGCILGLFLALWAAIAGLIALIVKSSQKTPEEQLLKMAPQLVFGAQIVGQPCPVCEEPNEQDTVICFRCGSSMTPVRQSPRLPDAVPLDKIKVALDELGQRPSLLFQGKRFWDAEIPIFVGIVGGLLLLIFLLALFIS